MQHIGILQLRNNIGEIVKNVQNEHEPTTITKNGKPLAVIISIDDYNSMQETLYLLGNSSNNQRIDDALEQLEKKKVKTGKLINV